MSIPMPNASFRTQANALLRKNLTYQKRNKGMNICLTLFPIFICVLLVVLQALINSLLDKPKYRCGCAAETNGSIACGLQYSTTDQAAFCTIDSPQKWPALLQIPAPQYRAAAAGDSCKSKGSCPATILLTGSNQSLALGLGARLLSYGSPNFSDVLGSMAQNVLGSASMPSYTNFMESAFSSDLPVYYLQPQCSSNSSFSVPITIASSSITQDVSCSPGLSLWRNSSSDINNELYEGYYKGNSERKINEIATAYDFLNSNRQNFNVNIWYNSTYNNDTGYSQLYFPIGLLRVPKSVNLASNAFLQFLLGPGSKILLEFVKEMPKPETHLILELSAILSGQFFVYIITLLFPVILSFLVYEKQNKLRMMMKMHGLGDGPYWLISYIYFLGLSLIYIIFLVFFASVIGLQFFSVNDYGIQFVFYFIYINLQVSLAFLVAPFFSNVLTARAFGYLLVFVTGLLGAWLFEFFLLDTTFSRKGIIAMELYPGFALYRGLFEFGQYAFTAKYQETRGMRWNDLNDSSNGLKEVLIIMLVEWLIMLPLAFYFDQVASSGNGVTKSPLFCLPAFQHKCSSSSSRRPSLRKHGSSKVSVQMETPDVLQEREKVEQLLEEGNVGHSIICDSLVKVYPAKDGNPPKTAVKGLSLAFPRGECFGMLGPNGAGKTSFISMMIGLSEPTSGMAFVEGNDIRTQMDQIYTSMGVCPQHDLLWGSLTAREHLLFYGRLKNLKGADLTEAVEASLKSVNLFHGGVGDKQARKYSGGMKRRLSVAISLIGNPKVVYMDEPSTGLDPASRNNLWNVVKQAKQDRAVILTTHSMEEAEVLCDRLGIFVNGRLQCIGNPKELKGRYGSSYVFTITTSQSHESEVEAMVRSLSPNALKMYHILGTQKFELPKQEVRISDVFQAVQRAKTRFSVFAWGLADTTLEDVFIKVAREAQASNALS